MCTTLIVKHLLQLGLKRDLDYHSKWCLLFPRIALRLTMQDFLVRLCVILDYTKHQAQLGGNTQALFKA